MTTITTNASTASLMSTRHVQHIRGLYNFFCANESSIQADAVLRHCLKCGVPMTARKAHDVVDAWTDTMAIGVSFDNFLAFYATKCMRSTLDQDLRAVFRLLDLYHTGRVQVALIKRCLIHTSDNNMSEEDANTLIREAFPDRQPHDEFLEYGEINYMEFERFMQM